MTPLSCADNAPSSETSAGPSPALALHLTLRDPELVAELARHPEGPAREAFALAALRVGVLAIRQASGVIDAATIREEGQRLIAGVGEALRGQSSELLAGLGKLVVQYFDPTTGVLEQRLSGLVRQDGEFDRLLRQHLGPEASTLAQTLARHVGDQSPLLRMLSPSQKDGVLAALGAAMEKALAEQRQLILGQFSLDQETSALSRLLRHLTDANGRLRDDLKNNVNLLCREFSLDNQQGALKRLVDQVDVAQRRITSEFDLNNPQSALKRLSELLQSTQAALAGSLTLDDDASPLSRMQRKLLEVIAQLEKSNADFHREVREALATIQATRREAERSTRHGGQFEEAVGGFLRVEAQHAGDLFQTVGETPGLKPRCKVGDHVITLGPDSAAPGERIVFEAKENQAYRESDALAEIREACENRGAQVGVFVFSRRLAPPGMDPLRRVGQDVLVVWDRDDALTDVYLKAALSLARALVVRKAAVDRQTQEEIALLEQAVIRISKDADRVGKLRPLAETARRNSQTIYEELGAVLEDLETQLDKLRECIRALRPSADTAAA